MNLDDILRAELKRLEADDLRRTLLPVDGLARNFASNDYLGFARHPALIEAGRAAAEGTGAGASRLVTGTTADALALEAGLASWKEKEAALLFGSGYAAAIGTIPAVVGRGDTVVLDKLAHASLIDAARLSGATVRVVPHNRVDQLDKLLGKLSRGEGRVLLVTESLFSMDGDVAPLAGWVAAKEKHGAWLFVDEAHATGLYGATGAGLVAEAGLSDRVEIVMGTLSKALGSVGGYVAGSRVLVDWLVNRARSFIYSTALPPAVIAASAAALRLAQSSEGAALREKLRANVALFREGAKFPLRDNATGAIQPIACGEAAVALKLAASLRERGFFVPAIRYPTVARQAARLRVTLSATHRPEEIRALTSDLEDLVNAQVTLR